MSDPENALHLAREVVEQPDRYPAQLAQVAVMLLLDPGSAETRRLFLELYQNASLVKGMFVGKCLPFPPEEDTYYDPSERGLAGVNIGVESVGRWALRLFPEQLRRHCLIVGMSGTGKTNTLQLIALGLGEIDR